MSYNTCKNCGRLLSKKDIGICSICAEEERNCLNKVESFFLSYKEEFISLVDLATNINIECSKLEKLHKKGVLNEFLKHITVKCTICGNQMQNKDSKAHLCASCCSTMVKNISEEKNKLNIPTQKELIPKPISARFKQDDDAHKYGFKKNPD